MAGRPIVTVWGLGLFQAEAEAKRRARRYGDRSLPVADLLGELHLFGRVASHYPGIGAKVVQPTVVNAVESCRWLAGLAPESKRDKSGRHGRAHQGINDRVEEGG